MGHHDISLTLNASMLHDSSHTRESTIACEDLWNTISLLMYVANFFTCSIALYAVLQYEQTYSALLEPIGPFWKFWGVKGLLSVNFMQKIVIMMLGAVAPDGLMSRHIFRSMINFVLICVEAAFLALINTCAYAPE